MKRHFYTTLALMCSIALGLIAIYAVMIFPLAKADTPHKGEVILFVTFDNGLVEETVFGGSFSDNKSCVASAKRHYPIDGKPWIAYMCIHEDVHKYLESMKNTETIL